MVDTPEKKSPQYNRAYGMSYEEFVDLSTDLEMFHSVFSTVWDMGIPEFVPDLGTVKMPFDKSSGSFKFEIDPDHWKSLNKQTKLFTICHECMHIIMDHPMRSRGIPKEKRQIADVAMDLVVNEALISRFGFKKELLTNHDDMIWFDNTFDPASKIERDREFEYYYNRLSEMYPPPPSAGEKGDAGEAGKAPPMKGAGSPGSSGSSGSSGGSAESGEPGEGEQEESEPSEGSSKDPTERDTLDDHSGMRSFAEHQEEKKKKHTDEEKRAAEGISQAVHDRLSADETKDFVDSLDGLERGPGSPGEPLIPGQMKHIVNIKKIKKKKKWESVISRWANFTIKERDKYQWVMPDRRMTTVTGGDLIFPQRYWFEDKVYDKINVMFFLDASGSCWHLKDRFVKAAASLDPKRFNVRMFTRTTLVKEVKPPFINVEGGGSDDFRCMENFIQKELREKKMRRYPEAVFHITDGGDCSGVMVKPQKPENWHWFLTDDHETHWIPSACHIYMLRDFE